MAAETKERITTLRANQALLEAAGDFDMASAILDCTSQWLHQIVNKDPALSARWNKSAPLPIESSPVNRPQDVALAEALSAQENRLTSSLERMGLTKRATSLGAAYVAFHTEHFRALLHLTGAGLIDQFLKVSDRISKNEQEIDEIAKKRADLETDATIGKGDKVALESKLDGREIMLREDNKALREFVARAKSLVDHGVLIQAKIVKIGSESRFEHAGKPGFAPLRRAAPVQDVSGDSSNGQPR